MPGTNVGQGIKLEENGKLLKTIKTYYETYDVSVDVKVHSASRWGVILDVTSQMGNAIGNRIPKFFVKPKGPVFHLCSTANDKVSIAQDVPLTLEKWTNINVRQKEVGGKYMLQYFVDRVLVYQIENKNAQKFQNIKVIKGETGNNLADCHIDNLKVTTPMSNGLIGRHEVHISTELV